MDRLSGATIPGAPLRAYAQSASHATQAATPAPAPAPESQRHGDSNRRSAAAGLTIGIAMGAGVVAGWANQQAARFSFLLATPVILAAGVLKVPDLFGPLGAGIHGQILAGSVASFVSAYLAVRFLEKYFRTRTLVPFAIYCLAAGAVSFIVLAAR